MGGPSKKGVTVAGFMTRVRRQVKRIGKGRKEAW